MLSPALTISTASQAEVASPIVSSQPISEPVAAALQPQGLIANMSEAFRELDYDGVMVYSRGDEMRTVRLIHLTIDGDEYERIQFLDGADVEIVREAHSKDCEHIGAKLLNGSLEDQPPSLIPGSGNAWASQSEQRSKVLDKHYQLSIQSAGRIAGRASYVVDVRARDAHRYSHRLFIDKEVGLLLKSMVFDPQGKVLESAQFTQLQLGDAVSREGLTPQSASVVKEDFHPLPMSADSAAPNWSLSWAPKGFVNASRSTLRRGRGDSGLNAEHFTDGLSAYSVFVEPASADDRAFQARSGSTLAYTLPLSLNGRWVAVSVVGEIPIATAVKLAQSVELKQ